MKGLTIIFECQLCGKKAVWEGTHAPQDKVQVPKGWSVRETNIGADIGRLYPEWKGSQGPDVLPRLFCSNEHRDAFVDVEKKAAKAAHAAGLKVAVVEFNKLMKPAKLRAMDAVTALATAVQNDDKSGKMPDDIQTYEVLMEATVRKQMHIEGCSPEHAAQIALELCEQPQEMEVQLAPTWIETVERCEATGELSMEVVGKCVLCGKGIVERDVPGQPWAYDWRGVDHEDLICYPCGKGKDG